MKIALLLLLLLSAPVYAQRLVEPVRISISTSCDSPVCDEFGRLVRVELRKNRNVALTSRRIDYDVYVAATPLTEGDKFFGYAAAVVVVTKNQHNLSIHTGPSLEKLARHLVESLEREFFRPLAKAR